MFGFFKTQKNKNEQIAADLYQTAMAQSRQVEWYRDYGVPDDLDSRVELLIMHLFLILYHLKDEKNEHALLKELTTMMVADIDGSYRQDGVGDTGVAKRIAKLVEHFYGLCEKYEQAIVTYNHALLVETINKNLYGGHAHENANPTFFADYMHDQINHLKNQSESGVPLTQRQFQMK